MILNLLLLLFFFSSRRRHTRLQGDWSSDVCPSDLPWADRGALHRQPLWSTGQPAVPDRGPGEVAGGWEPRSEERRVGKERRSICGPPFINENIFNHSK